MQAAVVLLLLQVSPNSETLSLVCEGGATVLAPAERTEVTALNNSGGSASASANTTERTEVRASVSFEMANGAARVQLPAALGRRDNGWVPVKGLAVTDERITGSLRLNFLNTTTFEIDRVSGRIRFRGGFEGVCEPVDRSRRKF